MGKRGFVIVFGVFGAVILCALLWLSLTTAESAGNYVYLYPWADKALWLVFGPAVAISMAATVCVGSVAQYFNLNQYEFFFGAVDILLIYGTMFASMFAAAFLEFAVVGYFVRLIYEKARKKVI